MSNDPTPWDLAMEAIEDRGCDCDGDPEDIADHTCIAGRCEHALLTERAAREEARKERDAALAEVERLRAAAQPVVSERSALRWETSLNGTWALCSEPGGWLSGAYVAFHHGSAIAYAGDGAAFGRNEHRASIEAAVIRIATWAREDGYHVPPHPMGWDIGEEVTRA